MASRKPVYPFSSGSKSTATSKQSPLVSNPPRLQSRPQNPFRQPAQPAQLAYNGGGVNQRRPPLEGYGGSPSSSPNISQASLLLPKGPSQATQSRVATLPKSNEKLSVPSRQPQLKQKNSDTSLRSTPNSFTQSVSDKYSLGADPSLWGADIFANTPEPDDFLHNPDPRRDRKNDQGGSIFTSRGIANLGCLFLLAFGLVLLFAGYPLLYYFTKNQPTTLGAYNLGGINSTGQVPTMTGNWGLVDADTPLEALTKISYTDGEEWELVFSDEFNVEGRSFYPGDDPYWEAVDLHYWGTNNMEWYDPAAVTTKDGNLVITLQEKQTHDLNYEGGMLATWNKFCFTGGLIEVSAVLPGASNVWGLWPAIWTMGNLGRAGYGATLDGMWPYSYDSCDVGTLPNQTLNGAPPAAATGGYEGRPLSYLPGQRLSACTCRGEIHPGPKKADGSFVGRAAPEIDVLEAQVSELTATGHISQSAQWAPFNHEYRWLNSSDNAVFHNPKFVLNTYRGAEYQMTTSAIGDVNQNCYERNRGCHDIYGFEYRPGNDGFITWVSEGRASWTFRAPGLGPDTLVDIGPRPVPEEPMYIIMNLGMSENFGDVDLANLVFPTRFLIDWIRVYQPKDRINIGCNPKDFPTADYIDTYIEAYTNWELTTWKQFGQVAPKNRMVDNCT